MIIKVIIIVNVLGVNGPLSVSMRYFALSSHFTLPVAVHSVCGGELREPVFCSLFLQSAGPIETHSAEVSTLPDALREPVSRDRPLVYSE